MTRPAGTLWLVLRLTVARRADVAATVLLAVTAAALTFLGLATVAVPHAIQAQQHRRYLLTPRLAAGHSSRLTSGDVLRTVDPSAIPPRRWHEHDIVRSYYSGARSALSIPGVSRPPRADEYYASPALQRLIRRDGTVAALFSGMRLIGTVTPDGLVQPHELRAVVGVRETLPFLVRVRRFGAEPSPVLDDNSTLDASVASIVALAVWLPGLAAMIIATRLGSGRRRRRSRALRLLGASASMIRRIDAVESMVVAVPASLLGCLTYWAFVHRITEIPGTSFGYFTADAEVSVAVYLLVALGVTSLVAGTSVLAFRMDPAEARVVDARTSSRIVALGLGLFATGLIYLLALPALVNLASRATLGLWIACGCVSVGLAVAGPRLVMALAGAAARRARAGGTLVGLRLVSWGTTTSTRLGSTMCVVVVMLLGGLSFMSLLNGGSSPHWERTLEAHRKVRVVVNDFGGALTLEEVLALAPGTAVAQVQTTRSSRGHERLVVYADRQGLAELSAGRAPQGLPDELRRAVPMPARLAPRGPNGHGSYFYLVVDRKRLDTTLARLDARAPTLQFDLGALGRQDPDGKRFPTQMRCLTTGLVLGLVIGALALVAAALGDMRERAARTRGLRILGAPPAQLLLAHYWSTAAPIIVLRWIATLCGWLACRAIAAFDDRADIGVQPIGLSALAVLLAGLVIATVTWPDTVRATSRA